METLHNMRDHLDLISLLGNKIIVVDNAFNANKLKDNHNLNDEQLQEVVKWFNEKYRYNDLVCFQDAQIILEFFKHVVCDGLIEIRQAKLDELNSYLGN